MLCRFPSVIKRGTTDRYKNSRLCPAGIEMMLHGVKQIRGRFIST
ncbi:hypothetical protein HMPREF9123_2254 [Neisseria bacilliformis ATCC BAA-1200]|uniref:Uncharacterized protein n=1 Tax=Neisseria bacilliformis ATCC BAA-1200 TaxID=888742 RepID=F2BEU7_9NEIS|nr:hypothetical protein HMPREF9123_2254 [Neisseria bacilliformis ATCC BAA-1200]